MPLIDLKTDLKSLKFGKDRPGGGSSNQPYIQKSIPDGDASNVFNTGGVDSLLRGGLMAPIKAANDTSRLTQMFFDLKSPNGLLFTAKQNVLSRTSVKTEATKGIGYGGGAVNQGIYLPTSTIAQAAVGFTGTHLNLLGVDPSGLTSAGLNKYGDVVKIQNQEEGSPDNRLVGLHTAITENRSVSNFGFQKNVNLNVGGDVLQYSGGPGSILGIGKTSIKFADQRTGNNNPLSITNPQYFAEGNRWSTRTKDNWISPLTNGASGKYEDYTDSVGSLIFPNGDSIISSDGNYTFNKTWNNRTTTSGSLEAREDVANRTYQSLRWSTRTKDNWISPLTNGVSGKYEDYVGQPGSLIFQDGDPIITTDGGYTYNQTWNNKTTTSGSVETFPDPTNTQIPQTKLVSIPYDRVITDGGASGTYIALTSASFDNTYNDKNFFNVYDPSTIIGNTWPDNTPLQSSNGSSTWTQQQIIDSTPVSKGGQLQDFRNPLLDGVESSTIMSLAPDYKIKNIDNRVNHGNPGTKKDILKYSSSTEVLDKINGASIQQNLSSPNHGGKFNDLVKFSIGIQNQSTNTSNFMNFRAFIDSFEDAYSAEWGSTQYIGRGDKFHNYKGFDRTINMSWTVYAQSKAELIPMYKKLNYLASSLAPSYSTGGFMQGNLARLTVGGYVYNQLGIIKSVTYSVPEVSTWEIGIDEAGAFDHSVKELPHMIKVTGFSFVPIQDFVPQISKLTNGTQTSRFIQLKNGDGKGGNTNW